MKLLNTPMGVAPSGRRPWLRWVALAVFVVALAIAFVNLGRWQLDRLDQRRERNSAVVEHESGPLREFADVFNRPITEADQWQRVRVRGTYDAANQFLVRYRVQGADSGYEIVTPLQATSGAWVLVDRGFAVKPPDQDYPKSLPAPPSGQVEIVGYVRRDETGSTDAMTPTQQTIRLVNSTALAQALGRELVNGYLSAIETRPGDPSGLVPVQPPELNEGNHFSYALQWFMFAGLAGVGFFLLIRSDVRAMRRSSKEPAAGVEEG
ncbi:MAG TPA: SURF1 family protein [Propionicimonas sp.]|nr:SURF1 family protein [Propionicimonas sp.]HQA77236.1 SURF1 family protein [Propionicimonas sp.]HQD97765.1 SURF1 family protein [Propionicimonas sp.]